MTNEQRSRFSMGLALDSYCAPYSSITSTLPNFAANEAVLKSVLAQIQSTGEQQKIDKSGVTGTTKQLRNNLVVLASDNAGKLKAYAKLTNNITLLKEINYSESDFKYATLTDLKDYAQIVYDFAQANIASLSTYGITAATQTTFLAAITAYNASLPSERVGIVSKTQYTKQLVTLFKNMDTAINNMATAVEIVKLTQVNFYNGFQNALKVINTANGSIAFKGTALDAVTGESISKAKFTLTPTNGTMLKASNNVNENGSIVKKTSTKGSCLDKNTPEGSYDVTVEKPGYKKWIGKTNVVNGEMTHLVIKLEKE